MTKAAQQQRIIERIRAKKIKKGAEILLFVCSQFEFDELPAPLQKIYKALLNTFLREEKLKQDLAKTRSRLDTISLSLVSNTEVFSAFMSLQRQLTQEQTETQKTKQPAPTKEPATKKRAKKTANPESHQ